MSAQEKTLNFNIDKKSIIARVQELLEEKRIEALKDPRVRFSLSAEEITKTLLEIKTHMRTLTHEDFRAISKEPSLRTISLLENSPSSVRFLNTLKNLPYNVRIKNVSDLTKRNYARIIQTKGFGRAMMTELLVFAALFDETDNFTKTIPSPTSSPSEAFYAHRAKEQRKRELASLFTRVECNLRNTGLKASTRIKVAPPKSPKKKDLANASTPVTRKSVQARRPRSTWRDFPLEKHSL